MAASPYSAQGRQAAVGELGGLAALQGMKSCPVPRVCHQVARKCHAESRSAGGPAVHVCARGPGEKAPRGEPGAKVEGVHFRQLRLPARQTAAQ